MAGARGGGLRGRRPSLIRARRGSRLGVVGWTVIVVAVALVSYPQVDAAFFATTTNTGNALTAAATFPTYPASVVADGPLFYHRMDDVAGSVTATDSSGNNNPGVYGSTTTAAGTWSMDEGSGSTAKDQSGVAAPNDLTLTNATWSGSGRRGSALSFNGTTAYAATASSVLTTSASFSVAAWVYLSSTAATVTAVSQDGTAVSAFELGYDQASNRWAFKMRRSNSAAAVIDKITSTSVPATSTWTHLTGTYDTSSGNLRLYVNGTSEASMAFGGTAWNATGALQVGAGKTTSRNNFWTGRVDDVRVYNANALSSFVPALVLRAHRRSEQLLVARREHRHHRHRQVRQPQYRHVGQCGHLGDRQVRRLLDRPTRRHQRQRLRLRRRRRGGHQRQLHCLRLGLSRSHHAGRHVPGGAQSERQHHERLHAQVQPLLHEVGVLPRTGTDREATRPPWTMRTRQTARPS